LITDPSPLVRASAAEALGLHLDQANTIALCQAASDDYRLVRVRAAVALAAVPEASLPEDQRAQVRGALAELMESMRSRPDDMASHYNLGNLYLARSRMGEAVGEFETANRLQPDALPPMVNAALAYNGLGQNEKAEASLRRALSLDATNSAANLNLGMLLAEMGRMSEAEKAFRAAFKADPRSAQAAYNLGVLLSKDHPKEALTWCSRAAELRPENPQYGYTYAFYLYHAGKIDEALKAIRAVRQRHPAHEDSLLLERQLLQEQEQKRSGIQGH
jgi:tetratricopeptide (TPR) repeat protein